MVALYTVSSIAMDTFSAAASLEIKGQHDARTFSLDHGNTWRIGRNEQGEVVLNDDVASRNHAIVQRTEEGLFYLMDMGSRNGSFVNGRRVNVPQSLRDRDSISIGETVLTFRYTGSNAPEARDTDLDKTKAQF